MRVPVALKLANALCPGSSPSLRRESTVISALRGPIVTRALLPSSVIPTIAPAIAFIAESSGRPRVVALWDQAADYDPARPNRFRYGRIHDAAAIQAAVAADDPVGRLGYDHTIWDVGGPPSMT